MKRNFLIRSLFGLTRLLFVLSVLMLLISIYYEIFSKNGAIGSTEMNNHHTRGYNVPARYSITVPDSIVSYKTKSGFASANFYKNSNDNDVSFLKKFQNNPNARKSKVINTIKCHSKPELDFTINYQTTNGYISIKSPNKWFTILQVSNTYFGMLSWIIIFFLLMKIFSPLRNEISFSISMARKVRLLGLFLIIYNIIQLTSSFALSRFWGYAHIDSSKDGSRLAEAIQIQINPTLKFDFTFFIVGLGLLVIYYLLKTANSIEREHNLTV
ncbi:DUF2975 domain-containing protein [Marinifilum fragile]|uniref:DUF2975 domain-containing protein n=1 Tax=Marinifilum fragile TaxID=570161 RepID=UPI002AA730DC|nr:DUF2975 domain-containing protein [Marinifilum fragile]